MFVNLYVYFFYNYCDVDIINFSIRICFLKKKGYYKLNLYLGCVFVQSILISMIQDDYLSKYNLFPY